MRSLDGLLLVADRTTALFVGLAVGAVVAFSFDTGETPGAPPAVVPTQPARAPIQPDQVAASVPVVASNPSASRARAGNMVPAPVAGARPAADPPAPRLAAAVAEGRPVRIGVFGDSFGEGVWAGLYNQLRGDPGYEIRQFAERSTGFTRYRSLNILDDVRAKLDEQPVDVAILSFGANDTQGIYEDGRGHPFMSEGWQRIVTERVSAVVALMRERGAAVYWVGLPRMRDPAFDADIQAMNLFYADRMAALVVPYLDTVPLSVDGQGHYAPYLPTEPGGTRRVGRANDGVHMTIAGYIHLTRPLTEQLRASVAEAQARRAAPTERGADGQASGSAL
jgi:uncharacterized protein